MDELEMYILSLIARLIRYIFNRSINETVLQVSKVYVQIVGVFVIFIIFNLLECSPFLRGLVSIIVIIPLIPFLFVIIIAKCIVDSVAQETTKPTASTQTELVTATASTQTELVTATASTQTEPAIQRHTWTGPPTNYRLTKELGGGGYGTVSLCCDKDTGEEWAVKTMKPGCDIKQMLALEKEIEFLTSCQHERIVQYYDCVNSPTHGFMIYLELMSGGSVTDQIKRDGGPLSECLTLKYTEQVLEGLAYLHSKRVMHRDIKGGNVLRDTKGNVKLADFGLSKQVSDITANAQMTVVGTLSYMAPEVFRGRYDFKADIWSVGCLVVEMLTGKPPNEGLTDLGDFITNPKAVYTLPPETSEKTKTMLNATFKPSAEDRPSASDLQEQFFKATREGPKYADTVNHLRRRGATTTSTVAARADTETCAGRPDDQVEKDSAVADLQCLERESYEDGSGGAN